MTDLRFLISQSPSHVELGLPVGLPVVPAASCGNFAQTKDLAFFIRS